MREEKIWYVTDQGRKYGPMTWTAVMNLRNERRFSRDAQVWRTGWYQWEYLTHYFGGKTSTEAETSALMPSKYEALIYGGFGLWFLGFILLIISPVLGFIIQIMSICIELFGLYLVRKHVETTAVGLLGDILAILIIIGQTVFTVIIILAMLSL
jgi:hypothetical protein